MFWSYHDSTSLLSVVFCLSQRIKLSQILTLNLGIFVTVSAGCSKHNATPTLKWITSPLTTLGGGSDLIRNIIPTYLTLKNPLIKIEQVFHKETLFLVVVEQAQSIIGKF